MERKNLALVVLSVVGIANNLQFFVRCRIMERT
jgi:hypothetical protein